MIASNTTKNLIQTGVRNEENGNEESNKAYEKGNQADEEKDEVKSLT